MVGTGRGAELGVLIRSGEVLEKAGRVGVVLFDKTGTLTFGKPQLTVRPVPPGGDPLHDDGAASRKAALQWAAAVEQHSEHPIGRALVNLARVEGLPFGGAADFRAEPGRGVSGKVDGQTVLVGNPRLLEQHGIPVPREMGDDGRAAFIVVDGVVRALVLYDDPVRPEAADVVEHLRLLGMEAWMVTGDRRARAEALARGAGIHRVFAEVLPDQKKTIVEQAQATGLRVAMVGDGINDAPALAQADLGIAMGGGTGVALEAGDIVLLRSDLRDVVTAIRLARRTLATIKQNLFFAFVYNVVAIPLAALNLLNPMIASAAMALSSVSVVTNSLRLRRFGARESLASGAEVAPHPNG
jgi:Cu+-exporting ATPase